MGELVNIQVMCPHCKIVVKYVPDKAYLENTIRNH